MQSSSSKASTPQNPTKPSAAPSSTTGTYHTLTWKVDYWNRGRFEFRITDDSSIQELWHAQLQSAMPHVLRRKLGKLNVGEARPNGPNVHTDMASPSPEAPIIIFALYINTPRLAEYWPIDQLLRQLCDIADWDVLELHMPGYPLRRDASQDDFWKDYVFPKSSAGSSQYRILYEGPEDSIPLGFLFAATKKLKSLEEINLRCLITLSTFVQLYQEAHLPMTEWLNSESMRIPIRLKLQGMAPVGPASAVVQEFPFSSYFASPNPFGRIKYVHFGVISPKIGFSLANILYVAREGLVFFRMDVTAHPNECFADNILTCAKLTHFVVECREEQMESLREACIAERRGWKVEAWKMNSDDTRLHIAGSVEHRSTGPNV